MDPRSKRAAVARPARDEREPSAVLLGDRQRDVGRERMLREPLADQDDGLAPGLAERTGDAPLERILGRLPLVDPLEDVGLVFGEAERVLGDVPQPRPAWMDHEDVGAAARGLADPQVEDRHLLLRVQPRDEDHLRALHVPVARAERRRGGEELGVTAVERSPVIEIVGSEHGSRELGERVRVFVEQPSTREERHAATLRPLGDPREDLVERGRLEPAVADQRRRDATRQVGVTEREPPLVARPGVVHLSVVPREDAHDRSPAQVDADVAAGAAVLAHGVRRRKVERPRDETVRLCGERSDRADLHRVAGERRAEVLARRDRHAFGRASSEQLDEPVAADLVAETRAARAQHTAFAVELDER